MAVLKRILNFYINSSVHVALSVYAMTWITLIEYGIEYDENTLYFVFYASITGYNFVKYFGLAKFHHRSLAGWLKAIQVFSFLAFLAMCYYAIQLEVKTIVVLSILGLITFLYAIPILPKKYFVDDKKNLRQISGLKVYIIALVWSFTTVILPLINNNIDLNFDTAIVCLQRFLFVIALMLPFEIRDLNYDSLKLGTIPQTIGVKKTKWYGVILLLVFVLLELFKHDVSNSVLISVVVISIITLVFILFSNKKQPKYYSAFWVESLPIVWLAILLMLG